jgi:putative hydrolase of the HAD superfamily
LALGSEVRARGRGMGCDIIGRVMDALPRAILIDLDDTILDDSGCVDACWTDACEEASARAAGIDARALHEAIRAYARTWWDDPVNHQRGRLDLRTATAEIVEEALRQLSHDPALAREVANHYRDLREDRAALFPGAIETLEWLRRSGVRLGMMTNGAGPAQRAKIERFDLARHFDEIVIEGEFGCGKPDPRVFSTLLKALACSPEEAWAVGDNLEFDVFGAMDMGIRGIWVDREARGVGDGISRQPDRVIASIVELRC